MKKILIILAIFLLATNSSFSQSCAKPAKTDSKHIVKSNLLGIFTLFYEHPVSPKVAFQTGLQYNPDNIFPRTKATISIAPELKYYFLRRPNAMSGAFTGLYGKYSNLKISETLGTATVKTAALGLNFGYQHVFNNGIVTEGFAGAGYTLWKTIDSNFPDTYPMANYNFDIRLGISLGYSF